MYYEILTSTFSILLMQFSILQMKRLDLSFNSLKNTGARILSECIHNIDDIQLHDCGITDEGVIALSEEIKKRNTPVYNLLLQSNNYQRIKNAKAKFFLHFARYYKVVSQRLFHCLVSVLRLQDYDNDCCLLLMLPNLFLYI